MTYEAAQSTQLLATNCVVCGKALRDPDSVGRGMGPECSAQGYPTDGPDKDAANKLIHSASIAAVSGDIQTVLDNADAVETLGYPEVSELMRRRFVNAAQNVKIEIAVDGDDLIVKTPFRRADAQEFTAAWRAIEGRRYERKANANRVPKSSKTALWMLLKRFFPNAYGDGPKGLFRVPKETSGKTENKDDNHANT